MNVPLLDLKAQYVTIREHVLAAVTEVLDSQVCIGGPKVAELEQKIAAISDCKYAVGVSSGTDALLCSMMALGIGPGPRTRDAKVMERFRAVFGIPGELVFHFCIPLGYPRGAFGPNVRRPTSETTSLDQWGAPVPWA